METLAKIRVALIGLNAPPPGTPSGTNWAAGGHLPYLLSSDRYQLVALQNSSAARAAESIKAYGLDVNTKAYGTPEEVANDPDIDLVVSCIRVDRHAGSLLPSIKAGKDVFTEWPMEADLSKAKVLATAVKQQHGTVRHIVGLQGRYNPLATKLRDNIASGAIGKVESSTVVAHAFGGASLPSPVDYFADKTVGGNPFTIVFAHSMEFVQQVLGDIKQHKSLLVRNYPTVSIYDPLTREVIDEARPNDVPDQVILNAVLSSGAILTYKLHGSAAFDRDSKPRDAGQKPKIPAIEWRIFGSQGQIRITSYDGMCNTWSLNYGSDLLEVEIYDARNDILTQLPTVEDDFAHLPAPARNVARLYEAFAKAKAGQGDSWYPDFEYGVKKHELIDVMYKENDMQWLNK